MRADPLILEAPSPASLKSILRDVYELTKPRITFTVLITTLSGMWLAAGGPPALPLILWTLLGVGMASSASCAFNNYIDREIDKHMERTRQRPLPTGRLQPQVALIVGSILGLGSLALLAWQVNWLTAGMAVFTIFWYVVIYTIWLKRTSPLNTSIGGVSGALPSVLGVTAVTGTLLEPVSLTLALSLFGIMYLWQPPHFWALALIRTEEYRRVGIPMLPVVKGERVTKRQMLIYTILLLPASLSLFFIQAAGWIYLITATVLGIIYLVMTVDFIRRPVERKGAYRLFFFSILYICILFVVMFINPTL